MREPRREGGRRSWLNVAKWSGPPAFSRGEPDGPTLQLRSGNKVDRGGIGRFDRSFGCLTNVVISHKISGCYASAVLISGCAEAIGSLPCKLVKPAKASLARTLRNMRILSRFQLMLCGLQKNSERLWNTDCKGTLRRKCVARRDWPSAECHERSARREFEQSIPA